VNLFMMQTTTPSRRYPRLRRRYGWLGLALLLGTSLMTYSQLFDSTPQIDAGKALASRYADGQFHNLASVQGLSFADGLKGMWHFLMDKSAEAVPDSAIPLLPLTTADLLAAEDNSLWRLGHSTVLLKLAGQFWITDPVFTERASPFGFAGPKRFHQAPITVDALPPLAAVILSHDHYDHLDKATVLTLASKTQLFVTPLGVGQRLQDWGIAADKIRELDWWQSTRVGALQLTATPAQHFSGRSLSDRNRTLWASWVIDAPEAKIFFSGDSGYFAGFKAIGERLGPFDLTLIENGAYDPAWAGVHMQPEETLQAHQDLRGNWLLPIHNGTFDLALHAWREPLERITALAEAQQQNISTPRFGEQVKIAQPQTAYAWWQAEPARAVASHSASEAGCRSKLLDLFGSRCGLSAEK
jgi:L-ascorbate metabolism protein UlaG (beta-lactamase superfamily)